MGDRSQGQAYCKEHRSVTCSPLHMVTIHSGGLGHDYQGRSAAPSTLQVNTHQMDSLSYVPEFVPQGSNAAPVPALTMGAGTQIYNSKQLEAFTLKYRNHVRHSLQLCCSPQLLPSHWSLFNCWSW